MNTQNDISCTGCCPLWCSAPRHWQREERGACGTHNVNINLSYTWMCVRVSACYKSIVGVMRFVMMPIRIHVECIVHTTTCIYRTNIKSLMRKREGENTNAFVYFIIWWMRARMYFSVNLKPHFGIGGNEIQHSGRSSSSRHRAQSYWQWMMESHSFPSQKFHKIRIGLHNTKWMMIFSTNIEYYTMCYNVACIPDDFSRQYTIIDIFGFVCVCLCARCWSSATIIPVRISIL